MIQQNDTDMNMNNRMLAPDTDSRGAGEETMGNSGSTNLGVVNGTSGTGMERDLDDDGDDVGNTLGGTSDSGAGPVGSEVASRGTAGDASARPASNLSEEDLAADETDR
ncbi:hypothetical protein [Spirosoma koreense]